MAYEAWLSEQGCYDLMDLVNHIRRQIGWHGLRRGMTVHFLMIDEIQDLTTNMISLFRVLATKNVYFAGDTA